MENPASTHECPPFAIINPDDMKTVSNASGVKKIIYGRQYPWGFVDAFNTDYSDFGRLYKLIISNKISIPLNMHIQTSFGTS